MYNLVFNGKLECKYPNEFLEDWRTIKEKHNASFIGNVNVYDIGEFVDYQAIEDDTNQDNSDSNIRSDGEVNNGSETGVSGISE